MLVPRRNSHFIILTRQPNDMISVRSLSSQLFPGAERNYFIQSYQKATEKPYSYLLIDLFPSRINRNLRLRSRIFPDEGPQEVYLPRNG